MTLSPEPRPTERGSAAPCRWAVATSTIMAREAAKQVRTSAKLKALQRTPHHTIIHRIKLLLDRLPARGNPESSVAPAPTGKP